MHDSHLFVFATLLFVVGVAVYLLRKCKRSSAIPLMWCQLLMLSGLGLLAVDVWKRGAQYRAEGVPMDVRVAASVLLMAVLATVAVYTVRQKVKE